MTGFRRVRALALVTTLTLASARAAPLGNNPAPVQVIESPPTFGSCDAPISTVSTLSIDSQGADLLLSNTSSTKSQDALIFDLIVNGERQLYWVPVVLRPGSAVRLHAQFSTTVDSPIILLCKNNPVGIVDEPQPVVSVVMVPPDNPPAGP
jgi:hypothetical protein